MSGPADELVVNDLDYAQAFEDARRRVTEARWTHEPSPAENPVPGVVTFTARGNAALHQLADALVAECDGSPTSIANVLEQVLEADIEDLAESLSQSAQPAPPASLDVDRLGRSPGCNPGAPGTGIPR